MVPGSCLVTLHADIIGLEKERKDRAETKASCLWQRPEVATTQISSFQMKYNQDKEPEIDHTKKKRV